jgi:hypothetical protein
MDAIEELLELSVSMRQAALLLAVADPSDEATPCPRTTFLNTGAATAPRLRNRGETKSGGCARGRGLGRGEWGGHARGRGMEWGAVGDLQMAWATCGYGGAPDS